MIVVLTGGTGGAKFVDGLRQVVPPEHLTFIVNTGDDVRWWGLHVSPDVDSILYVLAGLLSKERGWGVQADTFFCLQTMRTLGEAGWFQVGDKDLATHLLRTQMLKEGKTLSAATAELALRLRIRSRVLPMSDDPVETRVEIPSGEITFAEYFVQRRYQDPVKSVRFAGAESAAPAPGVVQAILSAEVVLLAPSNPITSIGPILAVRGIREALRETNAPVVAVSPIVGGAAVSGPAGALMRAQGFDVSIAGVAEFYRDFLDVLMVGETDPMPAGGLRTAVERAQTVMRTNADRVELAMAVMEVARRAMTPPAGVQRA
jgi:LPPG:FO 2-phospho-L-lactate transferase